jgi:hypothetical protein
MGHKMAVIEVKRFQMKFQGFSHCTVELMFLSQKLQIGKEYLPDGFLKARITTLF